LRGELAGRTEKGDGMGQSGPYSEGGGEDSSSFSRLHRGGVTEAINRGRPSSDWSLPNYRKKKKKRGSMKIKVPAEVQIREEALVMEK